jgi:hypothetical protein
MAFELKFDPENKAMIPVSSQELPMNDLVIDNKDHYQIKGIYAIHCINTDRYYIGQSSNISARIHRHTSLLSRDKYNDYSGNMPIMQSDFNSGYDFRYLLLEKCESKDLKKKESQWIQQFHSLGRFLYNRQFYNKRTIVDCPTIFKPIIQQLIQKLETNSIHYSTIEELLIR